MDWDFTSTVRMVPGGGFSLPVMLPTFTNPVLEVKKPNGEYALSESSLVPIEGASVGGWFAIEFVAEDVDTRGLMNLRISTDEGDTFYFDVLVNPGAPTTTTTYPSCCFCLGQTQCYDGFFFTDGRMWEFPDHFIRATIIDGPACLIGVASPIDVCFNGFGYTITGTAWYFPAMPLGMTLIQCDPNCLPALPAPRPCIPIQGDCGMFDYVEGFPPGPQYWNAVTLFNPYCVGPPNNMQPVDWHLYGRSLIDQQSFIIPGQPPQTIPVPHGARTWRTFTYTFIQDLIPRILSYIPSPFELIVRYPCIIDFPFNENYPNDPFGSFPYYLDPNNPASGHFRVFFITVAYHAVQ